MSNMITDFFQGVAPLFHEYMIYMWWSIILDYSLGALAIGGILAIVGGAVYIVIRD